MGSAPPERAEWEGLIQNRVDPADGPSLSVIVGPAGGSWSSPLRVTGSDVRDYFAKFPEACPSDHQMSVVTEMVVARAGRMIGAPTCETVVMVVPNELQGEELKPGVKITSTVVHASVALDHCDEQRPGLPLRSKDDNRRRQVGCYAIYDWFLGSDQQWLPDLDDDEATHSHDHGMYLPPANQGYWTEALLQAHVNTAWTLPDDPSRLATKAVDEIASALHGVTRENLRTLLSGVPASWPVTDQQLECLGWFLECRAPAVAGRIEQLVST